MRLAIVSAVLAALVADVSSQQSPLSALSVDADTGLFTFCTSPDCDPTDMSLSFSISKILVNASLDTLTQEVTSSVAIADFDDMQIVDADANGEIDPWITGPVWNGNEGFNAWTMYARGCMSRVCAPRTSNAAEYARLTTAREDAIGIKLEVQQIWEDTQIVSELEDYDVPSSALRFNLSVVVSAASSVVSPRIAVSFLISASRNGIPFTNVFTLSSVNGMRDLKRVHVGSGMYMDMPMYGEVAGGWVLMSVAAKGYTSGELQDLILVTVYFGSVSTSAEYVAAISSSDFHNSSSPAWFSGSPVTVSPTGPTVEFPRTSGVPSPSLAAAVTTKMLVEPRGMFGICYDVLCQEDGSVLLGFAGLAMRGASSLTLQRFANSPAFIFSSPRRVSAIHGVEALTSNFSASIPQSRIRPPRVFSASSDPSLTVVLDQYLTAGDIKYGDSEIVVPRGGVKFAIDVRDWVFPTKTNTLELNMSVALFSRTMNATFFNGTLTNATLVNAFLTNMTLTNATLTNATLTNVTLTNTPLTNATWTKLGKTQVLMLAPDKFLEFPTFALVDGVAKSIDVSFSIAKNPAAFSDAEVIVTFTFPAFKKTLLYDPVIRPLGSEPALMQELRRRHSESWTATAGVLVGFLTYTTVVSMIQCYKKTKVKLDFSSIIP